MTVSHSYSSRLAFCGLLKSHKGNDSKNALQVHPFSFPSLLSSETDIIRKSNAMASGVPVFFFLSFFSLLDFTSLFHATAQAHYIPVHSPTTPQWAHVHQ